MLSVDFCERAVLDLRSIQLHYLIHATESAAQKRVDEIMRGIELLQDFPEMGAVYDDPSGMIAPGYRRHLAGSFWIYYTASSEKITIWRIFHSKQEMTDRSFVDL